MKKFFNDHLAIFFLAALVLGGVALYFALENKKKLALVTDATNALGQSVERIQQTVDSLPATTTETE